MKYYFVDVENVHEFWIELFKKMKNSDMMYLYTSKNTKLTYGMLLPCIYDDHWKQVKIKEGYIVCPKDNDLDCFLLGDLNTMMKINENKKIDYFIVSKDKGYDRFVSEMKENGYSISRIAPKEDTKTDEEAAKVKKVKKVKETDVMEETNKKEETSITKEVESVNPTPEETDSRKIVPVKEEKIDQEELICQIADILEKKVKECQGKKGHLDNAFDYRNLAKTYIKTKSFKSTAASISNSSNAKRFSGFVDRETRHFIEKMIG